MKKVFLICSILIVTIASFGQTIENEEKNLNKLIFSRSKTPEEITSLVKEWREFLADYGTFPILPYNEESNEVEYTFIKSYELSKEVIMNRILEWSALSFGSIDGVLHYKNIESGKIILKGIFSITYQQDFENIWGTKREETTQRNCYQTYSFTIKNNKMKVQISDIRYEYTTGGYMLTNSYIPISTHKFFLTSLYPITNFEPIYWKGNLNILDETSKRINFSIEDLNKYIIDYQNDYSF